METADLIISIFLFVLMGIRALMAIWTDDDIKEIKHMVWATFYVVVLVGGLVVNT